MVEKASIFEKNGDYYRTEDICKLKEGAQELENVINTLLEAGGADNYSKVCEIIKTDVAAVFFQVSRPLIVVRILATVEENQLAKGFKITIFSGRNLYALEELYQEIVFRLRRIEFDMDVDIKNDILQYMVDMSLSLDALIAVLHGTTYLYSKEKIWRVIVAEVNQF